MLLLTYPTAYLKQATNDEMYVLAQRTIVVQDSCSAAVILSRHIVISFLVGPICLQVNAVLVTS